MTKLAETQTAVHRLFREKMQLDVPWPDTDLFEAGFLDSLSFVDLLVHLEEQFSIELSIDEIDLSDFRSIASIAGLLCERATGREKEQQVVGAKRA